MRAALITFSVSLSFLSSTSLSVSKLSAVARTRAAVAHLGSQQPLLPLPSTPLPTADKTGLFDFSPFGTDE